MGEANKELADWPSQTEAIPTGIVDWEEPKLAGEQRLGLGNRDNLKRRGNLDESGLGGMFEEVGRHPLQGWSDRPEARDRPQGDAIGRLLGEEEQTVPA